MGLQWWNDLLTHLVERLPYRTYIKLPAALESRFIHWSPAETTIYANTTGLHDGAIETHSPSQKAAGAVHSPSEMLPHTREYDMRTASMELSRVASYEIIIKMASIRCIFGPSRSHFEVNRRLISNKIVIGQEGRSNWAIYRSSSKSTGFWPADRR